MKLWLLLAAALVLSFSGGAASARDRAKVDRLRLVPVATGLRQPVGVAAQPGVPGRLYVAEQSGLVRVLDRGRILARPYLDLRPLVWKKDLSGLLGLAFDPTFAHTHRLIVDYVGNDRAVHIVEYRGTRSSASPDSARELLRVELPKPGDSDAHFGGGLAFEPDGRLLVGIGDGATGDSAQDPATLLGKLVRLDLNAPTPEPEIIGAGLRNPWRIADDRVTGDVYVADVGDTRWEEVDVVRYDTPWPVNFGWPRFEGRSQHADTPLGPGTLQMPLVVYPHPKKACSAVVGGAVYRGKDIPALRDRYVFADFCSGHVLSVRAGGGSTATRLEVAVPSLVSSLGVGADGELYVVAYSYKVSRLYRLASAGSTS